MPKTSLERKIEWDLRNPELSRQRQQIYNKNYRESLKFRLTESEKENKRKEKAQWMRNYRLRKKEEKNLSEQSTHHNRPQVLGKLIKRARNALKGNRNQISTVLNALVEENNRSDPRKNTAKKIPPSVNKTVEDYFLNDEISRASPNAKDFVNVIENGKKKRISSKFLLYSVKEVFGMFKVDYPDVKIGLASFFKLKPENVLSVSKMPHNVCCCSTHENLRCALKSLQGADMIFKDLKLDNSLHKNFVCSVPNDDCFFNQCEYCLNSWNLHELAKESHDLQKIVSWDEWIKTNKTNTDRTNLYCNIEKVNKSGTIQTLIDEISEKVPDFLDHQYVNINQVRAFNEMKEKASADTSKNATIVVDFAEKYKCIQQNAPQSAHYGQTPISIFTVAIYHRKFVPMAVVSDCEKNTKEAVLAYIDLILESLPGTVKNVDFWSDNATPQFKNKYIIEGMKSFETRHNKKIRWNFFAPMHGKSVVDGIGGNVKRYVRQRTLSQDLLVNSAGDFASVAATMETKVVELSPSKINLRN